MKIQEKENLVRRYVEAYNAFDIDAMAATLHPECTFRNVSGGEVSATTTGVAQFRELAEKARALFASRRQTIATCTHEGDALAAEIDYDAVLRVDVQDGPRAGEALKLKGRSVFRFRDGLIHELTDYS